MTLYNGVLDRWKNFCGLQQGWRWIGTLLVDLVHVGPLKVDSRIRRKQCRRRTYSHKGYEVLPPSQNIGKLYSGQENLGFLLGWWKCFGNRSATELFTWKWSLLGHLGGSVSWAFGSWFQLCHDLMDHDLMGPEFKPPLWASCSAESLLKYSLPLPSPLAQTLSLK